MQRGDGVFASSNDYYIGALFAILSGKTLTVQAGVNVHFLPGASILLKGGGLLVQGTADRPVTFAPLPGTDGSGSAAFVLQSGFDYSAMVLQNAAFSSLSNAFVDNQASGSNTGALQATNVSFSNATAAFWPMTTIAGLHVQASTVSFTNGAVLTACTVDASTVMSAGAVFSISDAVISGSAISLAMTGRSNAVTPWELTGTNGHYAYELVTFSNVACTASSMRFAYYNPGDDYQIGVFLLLNSAFSSTAFDVDATSVYGPNPQLVTVGSTLSSCSVGPTSPLWIDTSVVSNATIVSQNTQYGGTVVVTNSALSQVSLFAGKVLRVSNSSLSLQSTPGAFMANSLAATGTSFSGFGASGIPVQNALVQGCSFLGANTSASVGLVVDGWLTMSDSAVSGVDTLFVFNPDTSNTQVSGCALASRASAAGAAPPYLVNNSSPFDINMANNTWGAAFQAISSGMGVPVLSQFISDVFLNIAYGQVVFQPFASAPV